MFGARLPEYLLPVGVSGDVAVLPSNTQLYPSTARFGRVWHGLAAASGLSFVLLLAVAQGNATLLALAFVLPLLGAAAMLLLARHHQREHDAAIKAGTWHQGVIVFPSGDVVLRFNGVLRDVDTTIESALLSRADVETRFSVPGRCWVRRHLVVHHLSPDGRAQRATVCETDVIEDVARVADAINEMHARAAHSGGGGII